MSFPISCDTFVCLPPATKDNVIIFGKNSDRPSEEVQEIVYYPHKTHNEGDKISCTYIEIEQVRETAAIILSKPSWMWGAEMGANSYGVCIGNEAVWTHLEASLEERLIGMDLVRLGLERGKTARDALNVITKLLEKYDQGGPCSLTMKDFTYHNSFLFADRNEAWVLETVGKLWAAEKVESGVRNISNSLSIGCKIDLMSEGLKEEAERLKLWKKGSTEFNFSKVFSSGGPCERFHEGKRLLEKFSKNGDFDIKSMMTVLRDEDSGICMGGYDDGGFASTSSQVSILPGISVDQTPCHWFTGTPDPSCSVFKPFLFPQDINPIASPTTLTESPEHPRNKKKADRRHPLYKLHEASYLTKICKSKVVQKAMTDLENSLINKIKESLNLQIKNSNINSCSNIFNESVESEMKLYSS